MQSLVPDSERRGEAEQVRGMIAKREGKGDGLDNKRLMGDIGREDQIEEEEEKEMLSWLKNIFTLTQEAHFLPL